MKKFFFLLFLLTVGIRGFAQSDSTVTKASKFHFVYAEEMAHFPGGDSAFVKYLSDSLRYPAAEKAKGIEGTVYVTFTIEKDGTTSNVHMAKELPGAPGFSAEAMRLISTMPAWRPGRIAGETVSVMMTQPVKFILKPQ